MLNYHIQELPDLQANSEERVFPKLTTYSQFAGRKMIKRIAMEGQGNRKVWVQLCV